MIGQMAIAIALLGFNDLGCSVTPTFLFRNRFYLQLSPHCPKMNKNSMWEVKKISRFDLNQDLNKDQVVQNGCQRFALYVLVILFKYFCLRLTTNTSLS